MKRRRLLPVLLLSLLLLVGVPTSTLALLPALLTSPDPLWASVKNQRDVADLARRFYAAADDNIESLVGEVDGRAASKLDGLVSSMDDVEGLASNADDNGLASRDDDEDDDVLEHRRTGVVDLARLRDIYMRKLRSGRRAIEDMESGAEVAVAEENELPNACNPESCAAAFTTFRVPYSVPCASASGAIPNDPQLPLNFVGNYDLCMSFGKAHFCTIKAGPLVLPLFRPGSTSRDGPAELVPLGDLYLGQCVANPCTKALLKRRFLATVRETSRKIARNTKYRWVDTLFLESLLEATTTVSCIKEAKLEQGLEGESMGTSGFFLLFGITMTIMMLFSLLGALYPRTKNKVVISFSLGHNYATLVAPHQMTEHLNFLNGVKVLSMAWIIYGRTVMLSTVGLNLPISNPTAIQNQFLGATMTLVRGSEFAVDTFFFLSGLLATGSMVDAMFHNRIPRLGIVSYIRVIAVRFIRVIPVYVFVMFFYLEVLPYTGSGPHWHTTLHRKDLEHSCRSFYSNLLFFNNLYPSSSNDLCMSWTWYLANDMQFFLLVPFLAALFLHQWRATQTMAPTSVSTKVFRAIRLYGPAVSLVLIQIITTAWTVEHYEIQGTFNDDFMKNIYTKPWCRISPYMIGTMLAMYQFDQRQSTSPQHMPLTTVESEDRIPERYLERQSSRWWVRHFVAGCAIGVLSFIILIVFDDYRCKNEKRSDCDVWHGFLRFGALSRGNWSQHTSTAYFSLGYAVWGVALAILTEYSINVGRKNPIIRLLSHSTFTPLARLTYTVYLVHPICLYMFYARIPGQMYSSQPRQVMDTIAFVVFAYAVGMFAYMFVERPLTSLLTYLFGFDQFVKRSQRTLLGDMDLNQELSLVADIDSETVIIGSPRRRSSLDIQAPLLQT